MIISLCTTCMNRLYYLDLTLRNNLEMISEYNTKFNGSSVKFELSLCNYDSKDNLDAYIINNYSNYIDGGTLVYTKVFDKEYFKVSHAKNIAYRQSNGDVIVNIDADNSVDMKLLSFIVDKFTMNDIDTIQIRDHACIGIIGVSKSNFYKLGGYNESMIGYGWEDYDLMNRLKLYLDVQDVFLPEEWDYNGNNVIQQNNEEKMVNYKSQYDDVKVDILEDMSFYNRDLSDDCLAKHIMNPNGDNFGIM